MTLPDVAAALAEAASAINAAPTLEETLDTIAGMAQQSLDGVDHVGVSMHRDGRIETVSATDQLVWELDALQYELWRDPVSPPSLTCEAVVRIRGGETRWPRYLPRRYGGGARPDRRPAAPRRGHPGRELHFTIASRQVIGQAVGILMEHHTGSSGERVAGT